jgi:hypothetical protein
MGIRSISSTAPSLGFAQPPPGGSGARRPVTEDPSVLSSLTWGDREIIAVMFGADILSTGRDADGTLVGVPPFVWLVAEDRRSGRLSVGSEITSSYLQAIWDAPVNPLTQPLTERSLAAALVFLGQRSQGATVDVRA